jgi:Flp pilus assembly protein TadG
VATGARGQSIVEFALILPVFMLLIAGAVEFGRAYFAYAQLLQAAQEGARYGAVLPHARDDAGIIARVRQVSPGGNATNVTVTATCSPTNTAGVAVANRTRGNVLTVAAQSTFSALLPFFPLRTIPMTATASMVIEQTPSPPPTVTC